MPAQSILGWSALLTRTAVCLWALSLMLGLLSPDAAFAADRPNVVFVLTDDQRHDLLGIAGHPYLQTPHIDRLAREGAWFRNAFVTTSLCSPSRASFLSGLYASSHGVVNNFTDYPRDLPSFPRQLQAAGYRSAYIGKWHMGEDDDSPRPGFDHWITHKGQGNYYDTELNIDGQRQTIPGYYTTVVTDLALQWLNQQSADRPFCLILGHKAPHTPYTAEPAYAHLYDHIPINYPDSAFQLAGKPDWIVQRLDTWHGIYGPLYGFREKFPNRQADSVSDFARFVRAYVATVNSIDNSVGRLYAALANRQLLDNTIFVFAGDNGSLLGEHGMTDKRTMHEPSIRIPFIVRFPPLIPAGTVVTEQVLNIDLAPSLLDACHVDPIPHTHGQSWIPLLRDATSPWRDAWFYEYNYESQFPYTPNVRGLRTRRYKFVRYPHGDGQPDRHLGELYDLHADPNELHNLIAHPRYASLIPQLSAQLDALIEAADGKTWTAMPLDAGIQSQLPDANIR